jgi:nucleotide-binding universal stress UspA family protein
LTNGGKHPAACPGEVESMKDLSIKKILVPIDFSKMSIDAIGVAKHIGRRFDAAIHLVHACEVSYPAGFMAPGMPPAMPVITLPEEEVARLAHRLAALGHDQGIASESCHLLKGAPAFAEICQFARETGADLIVTSTHGHTGLKHFFLGSTAERIVQHSPCPVFVARQFGKSASDRKPRYGLNKLLVPVDFSGCSLEGLHYAMQWADKFAAKIIVLYVVELGPVFTADGYAMYDLAKYREMARKEAERQMHEFVRLAKFGSRQFETAILVGQAVDEIRTFARKERVDLIITGTHGRTGLKHVLLGSTAELVVRHAPCPVLVAPSHPEARKQLLARGDKAATTRSRERSPKRSLVPSELLTKRNRKLVRHPFPERSFSKQLDWPRRTSWTKW